jgi:hypothetical protein
VGVCGQAANDRVKDNDNTLRIAKPLERIEFNMEPPMAEERTEIRPKSRAESKYLRANLYGLRVAFGWR